MDRDATVRGRLRDALRFDSGGWRRFAELGCVYGPEWWKRGSPPVIAAVIFAIATRNRAIVLRNQRQVRGRRGWWRERWDAYRVFAETARSITESLEQWGPRPKPLDFSVQGIDLFEGALAEGRGVVVPTGNFGSWEAGVRLLAARGRRVHMVMAHEPNPTARAFVHRVRTRHGVEVIYSDESPLTGLPILKALRRGEIVCMKLEGWGPLGGLTLSQGVLYGTTYRGGAAGFGTVYSINPNGTGFAVLKEFTGVDGAGPRYSLIVSVGVIYGTTEGQGFGTKSFVYKLNTDGSGFAVLKTFPIPDPVTGTNSDGFVLRCGLAAAGRTLFGATQEGGNFGNGVVFALRMDDTNYTVLKQFSANNDPGTNSDGAAPFPSLMLSQSTVYGTTEYGGQIGGGTLFSISLAPRLETAFSPDGFAFNVTGYPNEQVVIEGASDLSSPSWVPLQTNSVPVSFIEPNWGNYKQRFYRARLQ